MKMRIVIISATTVLALFINHWQSPHAASLARFASTDCQQTGTERNRLMMHAGQEKFSVRRVEFIGLTYTHDQVVRDRMTPLVQKGDTFSRERLLQSLRKMSRLKKSIYPLRWKDVVIQLNEADTSLDMIICFRQKPR